MTTIGSPIERPIESPIVSVRGLKKDLNGHPVLEGIDLEVEARKTICIIGRSGCGKSTLLRCLNGLEILDQGIIRIGEITLDRVNRNATLSQDFFKQTHRLRGAVGMVFQNFNLFPHLTVLENVVIAPMVVKKISRDEATATAEKLLDKVGLLSFRERKPAQLSGGQQQRAAIARALAMSPKVMLYDEPTSALDPELCDEVLQVMKTLDQEDMTQIVVTHEMKFARDASDWVVFMEGGKIVETATPDRIFSEPSDDRTRQFLKKVL